jgi:hypothetical protein
MICMNIERKFEDLHEIYFLLSTEWFFIMAAVYSVTLFRVACECGAVRYAQSMIAVP